MSSSGSSSPASRSWSSTSAVTSALLQVGVPGQEQLGQRSLTDVAQLGPVLGREERRQAEVPAVRPERTGDPVTHLEIPLARGRGQRVEVAREHVASEPALGQAALLRGVRGEAGERRGQVRPTDRGFERLRAAADEAGAEE